MNLITVIAAVSLPYMPSHGPLHRTREYGRSSLLSAICALHRTCEYGRSALLSAICALHRTREYGGLHCCLLTLHCTALVNTGLRYTAAC